MSEEYSWIRVYHSPWDAFVYRRFKNGLHGGRERFAIETVPGKVIDFCDEQGVDACIWLDGECRPLSDGHELV